MVTECRNLYSGLSDEPQKVTFSLDWYIYPIYCNACCVRHRLFSPLRKLGCDNRLETAGLYTCTTLYTFRTVYNVNSLYLAGNCSDRAQSAALRTSLTFLGKYLVLLERLTHSGRASSLDHVGHVLVSEVFQW